MVEPGPQVEKKKVRWYSSRSQAPAAVRLHLEYPDGERTRQEQRAEQEEALWWRQRPAPTKRCSPCTDHRRRRACAASWARERRRGRATMSGTVAPSGVSGMATTESRRMREKKVFP